MRPSPARAAVPRSPALRPGAFKISFQKIHSPATSRASGWACGGRLPRPTAARGPPLASVPRVRPHTRRAGAMLGRSPRPGRPAPPAPGACARTTSGPPAPPLPAPGAGARTTSGRGEPLALTSGRGCLRCARRASAFSARRVAARAPEPGFLTPSRVGWPRSLGAAKAHVAPGGGPRPCGPACNLAARRPPTPPASPRPADGPVGERGLRGHVARAQRFRFSGQPGPGAQGAVLEVRVPQVLHLQYGMYVWPCAVVLAQYLWFHRRSLPGKAVLEIGAGVSLPGILAAKCGAKVILSDSLELPHCLEVCQQSCHMNDLPQVRVVGLTWGHVSEDLLALPPQDIILASDVFFEPEDFEDILTTVYFLMQKNSKVQLWSTYQVRSADWSLEALLYKWDMKCVHIPLESFDADKEDIAGSTLPGRHTVEMLVISYAKDSL